MSMSPASGDSSYMSPVPFDRNRVGAAAVYCSDGRLGEQIDDLLHRELKLARCDRLAVPGGAACLAGHFNAYREEDGVVEQLRFLLEVHHLRRLILIAHEGCAYYTAWLKVAPLQIEARQRDDMLKAIRRVRQFGFDLEISAYFARCAGDRVRFERIGG